MGGPLGKGSACMPGYLHRNSANSVCACVGYPPSASSASDVLTQNPCVHVQGVGCPSSASDVGTPSPCACARKPLIVCVSCSFLTRVGHFKEPSLDRHMLHSCLHNLSRKGDGVGNLKPWLPVKATLGGAWPFRGGAQLKVTGHMRREGRNWPAIFG